MDPQLEAAARLRQLLHDKQERNPAYSIRALSKQLGVNLSSLSLFLKGKRKLRLQTIRKIAEKLPELKLSLQDFEKPNELRSRFSILHQMSAYEKVADDEFRLISDWYHLAILSLAECEDFEGTIEHIVRRLGIRQNVAESACATLTRLGLLRFDPECSRYFSTGCQVARTCGTSSSAVKRYHQQSLELAQKALLNDPLETRDFSSISMSIDPSKIEEARRRIQTFRRQLCAFLESDKRIAVYRLNVQLFPTDLKVRS